MIDRTSEVTEAGAKQLCTYRITYIQQSPCITSSTGDVRRRRRRCAHHSCTRSAPLALCTRHRILSCSLAKPLSQLLSRQHTTVREHELCARCGLEASLQPLRAAVLLLHLVREAVQRKCKSVVVHPLLADTCEPPWCRPPRSVKEDEEQDAVPQLTRQLHLRRRPHRSDVAAAAVTCRCPQGSQGGAPPGESGFCSGGMHSLPHLPQAPHTQQAARRQASHVLTSTSSLERGQGRCCDSANALQAVREEHTRR